MRSGSAKKCVFNRCLSFKVHGTRHKNVFEQHAETIDHSTDDTRSVQQFVLNGGKRLRAQLIFLGAMTKSYRFACRPFPRAPFLDGLLNWSSILFSRQIWGDLPTLHLHLFRSHRVLSGRTVNFSVLVLRHAHATLPALAARNVYY